MSYNFRFLLHLLFLSNDEKRSDQVWWIFEKMKKVSSSCQKFTWNDSGTFCSFFQGIFQGIFDIWVCVLSLELSLFGSRISVTFHKKFIYPYTHTYTHTRTPSSWRSRLTISEETRPREKREKGRRSSRGRSARFRASTSRHLLEDVHPLWSL